jgi:hypothetical protein
MADHPELNQAIERAKGMELFTPPPREYFLRLFPVNWVGERILQTLAAHNYIDPVTLKWNVKSNTLNDLAVLLMRLRSFPLFNKTVAELPQIAKQVFSVEPKEDTFWNAKPYSRAHPEGSDILNYFDWL